MKINQIIEWIILSGVLAAKINCLGHVLIVQIKPDVKEKLDLKKLVCIIKTMN
nr:MAG TPA: hypothetical protein [Caudoviricetes sp.]